MLNFKENFFFIKFSVLFFLIVIFGYWGIDLNSEELYIAFSFLFLVILAFVLSRKALLFVFVKSVNLKFMRIVADLFVIVGAITLQLSGLFTLKNSFKTLYQSIVKFCSLVVSLLGTNIAIFEALAHAKMQNLHIFMTMGLGAFFKIVARSRRTNAVVGGFSKFFNITF